MINIIKIVLIFALVPNIFFSCSKQKEISTDDFINQLVHDVEIDLTKINKEVINSTSADLVLKSYRNNSQKLYEDIDSLVEKYPDYYDLKALKINFLRSNPEEASKYIKELYYRDSLNSHHQFFYGTNLNPLEGKEFFVKIIKQKKDDPFGYLGLAFSLLYARSDDLQIPAKLVYLSILKDSSVDDSFEVLNNIFGALKKTEDAAMLNGIMLVKDPSNSFAFDNIFNYYFEENEKDKAKDLLETFIKNNPENLSNTSIAERYIDLDLTQNAVIYIALARNNKENDPLLDYIDAKLKIKTENISSGMILLEKYANANLNDRNLIFRVTDGVFAEKLIGNKKYKELLNKVENGAPTIGDSAPELAGNFLEGSDFSNSKFAGKVFLIDFWAEWCNPCKMEMPNVIAIYEEYNSKGFEIIGVNLDKESEKTKALNYIAENNIKWQHIFSGKGWEDENVSKFMVIGIPATFLVDKKGIIRYKYIRGKDLLSSKVEKLLSE